MSFLGYMASFRMLNEFPVLQNFESYLALVVLLCVISLNMFENFLDISKIRKGFLDVLDQNS